MSVGSERQPTVSTARSGWTGPVLIGGTVVCLTAAGLLLWSDRGGAVFGEMVLAAVAWCF